jgi:hypothetical protein
VVVDHLFRLAVTEDLAVAVQELLQMSLEEAQAHLDKVTLVVLDQIIAAATMALAQAAVVLLQLVPMAHQAVQPLVVMAVLDQHRALQDLQ